MRKPDDCETMAHIRAEIDRIDESLIQTLADRARYIDRAAQIKAGIDLPARITERVEEVVQNVRNHAADKGLPPELAELLWRQLIDWSIEREERFLAKDKG